MMHPSIVKGRFLRKTANMGLYDGYYGRAPLGYRTYYLGQTWDSINPELEMKRRQMKELLKKKYHGKEILRNSLMLSLSLIIILVLYVVA